MKALHPFTRPAGYSLLELLVALVILLTLGSVALPNIVGYRQEMALVGAAQGFRSEFMKARSIATKKNTQTAIRFEKDPEGLVMFSTYIDGNFNGVRKADIDDGVDLRIAGPFRLDAGHAGVDVGVLPDVVAPDGGPLGSEPIRFGSARMVSFSPLGTGTPGTFYLRTRSSMVGVRVTGGSARVRILIWRGKRWIDRQG
ncbi:MAG: type II secretion system protein [Vicinamibacteria bacterium]|jgi:prepilin-type N-terminal cleavage/methylation domain-containing protein|nr:type II secretion system protein [Vicinamibacteria bacterium]